MNTNASPHSVYGDPGGPINPPSSVHIVKMSAQPRMIPGVSGGRRTVRRSIWSRFYGSSRR